jgi:hypothetical protein
MQCLLGATTSRHDWLSNTLPPVSRCDAAELVICSRPSGEHRGSGRRCRAARVLANTSQRTCSHHFQPIPTFQNRQPWRFNMYRVDRPRRALGHYYIPVLLAAVLLNACSSESRPEATRQERSAATPAPPVAPPLLHARHSNHRRRSLALVRQRATARRHSSDGQNARPFRKRSKRAG